MKMRALSLWQPWASAIAVGVKSIETRSWSTAYRGPIAIHAAKKSNLELKRFLEERLENAKNLQAFHEHRLHSFAMLPFGAVVATAELADCVPVEDLVGGLRVGSQEMSWGNYDQGRFGWMLRNVRQLSTPIAVRGAQGLFTVGINA